MKDVVMIGPYSKLEVDFIAVNGYNGRLRQGRFRICIATT